jgi:hypothetical protein
MVCPLLKLMALVHNGKISTWTGLLEESPAKQYAKAEANLYFPVGPPYVATVRDMYKVRIHF